MKYSHDKVYIGRDGKPITKKDIDFLNLVNMIETELGAGALLGFKAILEAIIAKGKKVQEKNNHEH